LGVAAASAVGKVVQAEVAVSMVVGSKVAVEVGVAEMEPCSQWKPQ